ncbi:MAG: M20/M25/M40 family metallo-hydrolase [Bacteroidetes bacterium]|jgi:acetylornithine deacetylase/succinyl-diaminopimelate desuccinylase-like protein|nr:M20/M25/M40 family metallo-hydrolase [Bacteroidota bacterium]
MPVLRSAFLAFVLALLPGLVHAQPAVEAARSHRQAHEAQILRDYADFLRIPNVASDSVNIRRNARHIQQQFAARDVDLDVLTVDGVPPIVTGRIEAPGATRTLGIYVHYDGQPVDASRWTHGPWTPTLYTAAMHQGGTPRAFPADGESVDPEARLYARGAGDDKAPIAALLATLDALQERDIELTSNIVFLFDGEEERGSPHLNQYLSQYEGRFADVDLWLFCDGPVHQSRQPQVVFGVRGVTGMEVTVYGANRPLHSGHYGNWSPVPGQMLANLLATMKSTDGAVLIDGFYDTVAPLTAAERAALDELPLVDEPLKDELALARTEGTERLEERLLLPSLTVRGLASGNVGAKARNIIPSTATAALGVRLVKGNDPNRMLDRVEDHIRAEGYHIVRETPSDSLLRAHPRVAKVTRGAGYPASRASMGQPLANQVIAAAERASGQDVLRVPTLGGTLPVFLFEQVLGTPAIIVPIANHDNNQHAPDENIRLANLWYGVDLYAALLTMPAR